MGTGAEYIPEQALPCRISAQQARANALALVHQHPEAFAGHDVDKAIGEQMALTYVPMELADLRMMASFPEAAGQRIAGVLRGARLGMAEDHFVDIPLMGLLEPWDFSTVAPFDPAMQEGDFRVIAVEGLLKKSAVIGQADVFACGKRCREGVRIQQKEHAPMGPQRAQTRFRADARAHLLRRSTRLGRTRWRASAHSRERADRPRRRRGVQREEGDPRAGTAQPGPSSVRREHRARNAHRGEVREIAVSVQDRPHRRQRGRRPNGNGRRSVVPGGETAPQKRLLSRRCSGIRATILRHANARGRLAHGKPPSCRDA